MSEPLNVEDIYHFTVRYVRCQECKGWDEFYDGMQAPRRAFGGNILDTEPRPNGLVLKGRRNHRRICRSQA